MALEKLSIVGYSDKEFASLVGSYDVLINPDTYTHSYRSSTTTGPAREERDVDGFNRMGEETVAFKILFDGTGVVPGRRTDGDSSSIKTQIDKFRQLVFDYKGNHHRPNFVKLKWGTLRFKCQLKTLNLKYTLFSPTAPRSGPRQTSCSRATTPRRR